VKIKKSEVNYSQGMLHSHCGPTFHADKYFCRHFILKPGLIDACERVEGPIDPKYWCELFKRVAKA
jgi:hypothetical protein